MNAPLAVLAAIDWSGVTDCYGPVDELPALLRATLSRDPEEQRNALMDARNQVNHQGDVCDASVHIVPFLAAAALSDANRREAFVYWLAWSCEGAQEAERDRTGLLAKVRGAAAVELPALTGLLNDPDRDVRRATLMLIAAFPHEATATMINLSALTDPDPLVRADLLTVVAHLQPQWPGLRGWLAAAQNDENPTVAYQATRVLMRVCGAPYPAHLVDTLADLIADHGLPEDDLLDAIEDFCGVPGRCWPAVKGHLQMRADPLVQDPDAAVHAARRLLRSASPHARYALTLAGEIDQEWRGREHETVPLALDALPAITETKKQYEALRWIARMLAVLEEPSQEVLTSLEAWGGHAEPTLAAAAWAASAHVEKQHTAERLGIGADLSRVPLDVLRELCQIYGPDGDFLITELRRRVNNLPQAQPARGTAELIGVIPHLGPGAREFIPTLHAMLEQSQNPYTLIETLGAIGRQASETADLIEAIAHTHDRRHFRLRAARAHRAITGDHTLARHVAAEIAESGKLDHWSIEALGLLGPDAQSCTNLLEAQRASRSHYPTNVLIALWRITHDREKYAPHLAAMARSSSDAIPAIQCLLKIGQCPDECRPAITRYADSPERILYPTPRQPPHRGDYLLQRLARKLLSSGATSTK